MYLEIDNEAPIQTRAAGCGQSRVVRSRPPSVPVWYWATKGRFHSREAMGTMYWTTRCRGSTLTTRTWSTC